MKIKVHNPAGRKKKMAVRKKARTAAQKRATKKLVAFNKSRRRKKNVTPVKRKRKRIVRRKRAVLKPKRRKRNVMAKSRTRKRVYKRRPVKRARKRVYKRRKNPGFSFLDVIQSSVLAGIGGMAILAGSNGLATMLSLKTDKQKSLVRMVLALAMGVIVPKMTKKNQADPLVNGAMAIVWISALKTIMPAGVKSMFLMGESEDYTQIDNMVDDIFGIDDVTTRSTPGLRLLGEAELGEVELGAYENQAEIMRW